MAIVALAALAGPARADGLRIVPESVVLQGRDGEQHLLVESADGRDLSRQATFASADEAIATVDARGTVTPRGDGKTTVTARFDGKTATVAVEVRDFASGRPIHFANQIVPIFTRLGCNSGGCHGKSGGQNGFRLSLLGFEPNVDYETLVKEGRGRRLFPAAPEQSLLLRKATGDLPHGGGKKLAIGSPEYRLLARWIAGGMPYGKPGDRTVSKIEIYPARRTLVRREGQQLLVTAHYTDGSTEDVTRLAQYQSNEADVAVVEPDGLVEAREATGIAAVMARYQGHVGVFRATVPLAGGGTQDEFPASNFLDELARKQWRQLGIAPSAACTDEEFIRRASLDLTGTLPTAEETRAFLGDATPSKREALVDRLLERPEYASYFATKWAGVLRNKRDGSALNQTGTYRFHEWIRENLARNTPYDRFVRSIVSASGTPESTPPVVWYRKLRTPEAFVDDTAQVFLGMRLQCARCHHHPFERWSQDDFYGFAAFFSRIGRKTTLAASRSGRPEESIFNARTGGVTHPKSGRAMQPKGLGGEELAVSPAEDPRKKLADWMTDPQNPYFARAVVNRYWAHFFGRGLVEPIDDMRVTNPPANPELLDALADDFVKSRYDLKRLARTLATSRVYGLSSVPNATNARDKQSFSRHVPRRMTAEVLLDAMSLVSEVPTPFTGLPAGTKAIELPDEGVASTFLDIFGRPKRDTACECERITDATLGQSLMLLNSADVQTKIASQGGRAERLAKDPRPDAAKIEELFWAAFARPPASGELAKALDHVSARPEKKKEAYEDILWALLNSKEFQFIR